MADKKTIAIFGAGTGLGTSLAKRFGGEGYNVALVARNPQSLNERVGELTEQGIAATAFPGDLSDLDAIAPLVKSIEAHFGAIDVAVFAPVSPGAGFVPAVEFNAQKAKPLANLFTFAPIELASALLPNMLARNDGAIVVVAGMTAVTPMPGMSGVGPMMAAARNFIHSLHHEVKDRGVYAGAMKIGAMIERSAGMKAATAGGNTLDPRFPVIDPDVLADELWSMVTERDRADVNLPDFQKA